MKIFTLSTKHGLISTLSPTHHMGIKQGDDEKINLTTRGREQNAISPIMKSKLLINPKYTCEHPILRHSQEPIFFENAPTLASSSELTRLLRNAQKVIHASSKFIKEFKIASASQLSGSGKTELSQRRQSSKRTCFSNPTSLIPRST